MANYLSLYGWHFSKKMCEWAVSKMEVENKTSKQKEKLVPIKNGGSGGTSEKVWHQT